MTALFVQAVYAKKNAYPAFKLDPVLSTCWMHDDFTSGVAVADMVSKIEISIAGQNIGELWSLPNGHSPLRCD